PSSDTRPLRFFFSSRRRHTRWPRDWSSDVCSSDLAPPCSSARRRAIAGLGLAIARRLAELQGGAIEYADRPGGGSIFLMRLPARAEERRVGKRRYVADSRVCDENVVGTVWMECEQN